MGVIGCAFVIRGAHFHKKKKKRLLMNSVPSDIPALGKIGKMNGVQFQNLVSVLCYLVGCGIVYE